MGAHSGISTLPIGTRLERYVIEEVLGVGGFGVTYLAEHQPLKKRFAIKEHFPTQFAVRDSATGRLAPTDVSTFQWAVDCFLREARLLARLRHPNIVVVSDVLEANNTGYMVLEYEQGRSLDAWLRSLGRPPTQSELDAIVAPLLAALSYIHTRGLLHRDIAPDNIILRAGDGSPCLIDFGAAREAVANRSQAMSAVVKPGYSPPEQYARSGKGQGPWSDIYAMSATLYHAVTGKPPAEATERQLLDELKPLSETLDGGHGYRATFLATIDAGLQLNASERPQSVEELWVKLAEQEAQQPSQLLERFYQRQGPVSRPPELVAEPLTLVQRLQRIIAPPRPLVGALAGQLKSGRLEAWFRSDWAPLVVWVLIAGASWFPMISLMDTIVRWSKGPGLSKVWFFAAALLLVTWLVLLGAVAWLSIRSRIPLPKLGPVTELVSRRRLPWWHRAIFIALVAFIATLVVERYHAWLETPIAQRKDNVPDATSSASPKVPAPVPAKKPSQTGSVTPAPSPSRCEGTEAHFDNEMRCLKPKDTFKDCADCPEMVVIPAGDFTMGSDEYSDEKPVHKVTIAKPLTVSKFEVTFANWDTCVIAGGCKHLPDDGSWGRGERPVINISWNDITNEYLPWLSRTTSKDYRLLTEAEWEYAARAGSRAKYTWGDEIDMNRANCDGCGSRWDNKQTALVGSFQANAFGLHDMHGNVWEWVEDCWHDNYKGVPADGSSWTAEECKARVLRGGSWVNYAVGLRSAVRRVSAPVNRSNLTGFRLARTFRISKVDPELLPRTDSKLRSSPYEARPAAFVANCIEICRMEPKCQAFEFYDNMDTCWLHDAFKGYLQAQGWHAGAKSVAQ